MNALKALEDLYKAMPSKELAEKIRSHKLIIAYQNKIQELCEQMKAVDMDSIDYDVLCQMQGGLQDAMQREFDRT